MTSDLVYLPVNSNIAIVDRFDKLVPLGARGEVVISGACLSSGGYVSGGRGQGQSKGQSGKGQGRTSSAASKQHIHFRTGDIGRIIQESGGPRRLFIEGRFDNESLTAGGETINLKQWRGQVLATAMVEDAAVLTYHRGRDVQVTVAAVVLKEDKTCIQVLEKIHEKINGKGGGGYVVRGPLPTVFALEEVPHLRDGRVDKKAIRGLFRKILLECECLKMRFLSRFLISKVPKWFQVIPKNGRGWLWARRIRFQPSLFVRRLHSRPDCRWRWLSGGLERVLASWVAHL